MRKQTFHILEILWKAGVALLQNHRIIRVGKDLQDHQVQAVTNPHQSNECHVLEDLQGWELHHIFNFAFLFPYVKLCILPQSLLLSPCCY